MRMRLSCSFTFALSAAASAAAGDGEPDAQSTVPLEAFCGGCRWKQMGFNCSQRVAYLMDIYSMPEDGAKKGVMERGDCIDSTYAPPVGAGADAGGGDYGESIVEVEASKGDGIDSAEAGVDTTQSSSVSTGAIVGICLGVIAVALLAIIIVRPLWRKKKKKKELEEEQEEEELKKSQLPVRRAGTKETVSTRDDENRAQLWDDTEARFFDEEDPSNRSPLFEDEAHSRGRPRWESPETLPSSKSSSPQPEPEIWIQVHKQENMNAFDHSHMTFDDDWSYDPLSKPVPSGSTMFTQEAGTIDEQEEDTASQDNLPLGEIEPPDILKDFLQDVQVQLRRVPEPGVADGDSGLRQICDESIDSSQDGDCNSSDQTAKVENKV